MAERYEGRTIADKYEALAFIARGHASELYRGRHLLVDKPVLLKVPAREIEEDNEQIGRFFAQAKTEAKFTHPNILNLTDFGSDNDGTPYAVYENSEVETLRELLDRAARLPAFTAIDTARQIAGALAAAHQAGSLHGRLTPETVLVTESTGTVKLFDLGAEPRSFVSEGGAGLLYRSPEELAGSAPDRRSDVYSLGVILYEMLAGEPPFPANEIEDLTRRQAGEPPAPLSAFRQDLPENLEAVVLKALAVDPEMRYRTAREFADDLNAVMGNSQVAAAAPASANGNNIWKTAFVVLAGISLLSAFLIYATSSRRTDPTTVLQTDANGQPVQPINPATGAEEQNLSAMPLDMMSNSNVMQVPGTFPGGDNYDPWARGVQPPPGAPPTSYVAPGGQVYTIDPNNPSQFMPMTDGVILVPVPVNTNTAAAKPSPTPRTAAANANANTAPAATPSPRPAESKPAATPTGRQTPPQQKPSPARPAGSGDPDD